jgi:hypothetical protein
MSPFVTGRYSEWQKDVRKLPELIHARRNARKKYDLGRQKFEGIVAAATSESGNVSRESLQVTELQREYDGRNKEFIALVDKLTREKAEIIAMTSDNFVGIMAHYGQLVFTDMQKFRRTFDAEQLNRQVVYQIPAEQHDPDVVADSETP